MSPRAIGSRTTKLARVLRTKKELELEAAGVPREEIARQVGVSVSSVWADLARIDAVANATVESAQFRIQQRNQINAELDALKQAALADPLLDIMERSQLLLAIHDRKIRMHCLDDSSLLPGHGSAGDAPVIVNLNVEFEDADDVAAQKTPTPTVLALPPAPRPEEPTPEPVPAEEPEMSDEAAFALIDQIRNGPVDPIESVRIANEELHAANMRAFVKSQQRKKP